MKEPKLYFLLKNLTREEHKRLRKVVMSPIFNTNPKVITLFESIRGQYPNFSNTNAMRLKLYSILFPAQSFNDQKLRRAFSDLTKVVEQYYVQLELNNQQFTREKLLRDAYNSRNLFNLFERRTVDMLEELEKCANKNSDYFLQKMSLLKPFYFHLQRHKYNKNDRSLETYSDSLDGFFVLSKMQINIAMDSEMKILKKEYRMRFLQEIKTYSQQGFLSKNIVFQLYNLSVQLINDASESLFQEYEFILFENIHCLNKDDQQVLFFNGLNFAIRQSNKGTKEYEKIAFKWLRYGLEKRLLLKNNQLSEATFGNIVLYGCRNGVFDWVTQFIKEYNSYLREVIKTEETFFSGVLLNFYQQKYEMVIDQISDYSFSNPYKLKTRNILIRTYFELFLMDNSYFFVLTNTLTAFEVFLYKNKFFTKERTEPYLNLIKILKVLSKRISKGLKPESTQRWLHKQLRQKKDISGKQWLEDKFLLNSK